MLTVNDKREFRRAARVERYADRALQNSLIKKCHTGCVTSMAELVKINLGVAHNTFAKVHREYRRGEFSYEVDAMRDIGSNDKIAKWLWEKTIGVLVATKWSVLSMLEGAVNITDDDHHMEYIANNFGDHIVAEINTYDSPHNSVLLSDILNGSYVGLHVMKCLHAAGLLQPDWDSVYKQHLKRFHKEGRYYQESDNHFDAEKLDDELREAWIWVHHVCGKKADNLLEDRYFKDYIKYLETHEHVDYVEYETNIRGRNEVSNIEVPEPVLTLELNAMSRVTSLQSTNSLPSDLF